MTAVLVAIVGLLALDSASSAPGGDSPKNAKWRTFVNRAGWRISYPPGWQIGSCTQCLDPPAPNVFVTFSDPSTKTLVMIEHLIDKPADQGAEEWLRNVSRTTVLNPKISEEWIILDHRRALKVLNLNSDSTRGEHIYVLCGQKTFAIRSDQNTPSYATYQRMLSTFKFVAPKP